MDLGIPEDAPPAYGDSFDHVSLSQAGLSAGAQVTDNGRLNINIDQTSGTFASSLASTLRSQTLPPEKARKGRASPPPAYIPPSLGGQPGQTSPPKLNVVIQIVGSRGDVQPFVALGKVLQKSYGHRVRLATHAVFQEFVESQGLEFFCIGGDPAELMAFMVKNPGLMPGMDAMKSGEITRRRQGIEQIVLGTWRSCFESGNGLGPAPQPQRAQVPLDESLRLPGDPMDKPFVADAIIANPPSFGHIHIAEKMGIPLHIMFTMPWSPTRAFPHPLANIRSTNADDFMTNYLSYTLVEMMTWQGLGDVINRFRVKVLDLEPLSLIWAPGLLTRLRIPTTYCWSPALIPKPNDWGNEIAIPGFFFLDLATSYTPDPDLAAFLEAGPPPVYIGFGSIVVDDPNALTKMIFDAVSSTGVRALVSKGWGGLGADSVGIPDGVFMLGNVPHDWLFQKVSCVVHHGGAGTTAAGIKAGVPTVVVPFFGDQPFWGDMIHRAGAGPKPVAYKDMTAEMLADGIREALKPETKARAKELGEKIRQEKGADLGGQSFQAKLDTESLRCSLVPSRVAVWRVRKSNIRLCALAAAVLESKGLINVSQLKLHRPVEYSTEGQPWDPITACVASVVADASNMGLAISDFPRELFKARKKASGLKASGQTDSKASQSANDAQDSVATEADENESADPPSKPNPSSLSHETSGNSGQVEGSTTATVSDNTKGQTSDIGIDTVIGASKMVGKMTEIGLRSPLNVCMALAKGFRNAPKLYNDDTVRPQEKVTDFASGLRVASRELGFGFYDGLSGLVTQPLRGAEKEGGAGLLKGIGKGIGGLVLKPAAAVYAVPAYTMQGVDAELKNLSRKNMTYYVLTSRILQGREDLAASNQQEQQDIIDRWHEQKKHVKESHGLLNRQASQPGPSIPVASPSSSTRGEPEPKLGWQHTRNLTFDQRKELHARHEAWLKQQTDTGDVSSTAGVSTPRSFPTSASEAGAASSLWSAPDEMESAIQASVAETSTGNREEDAKIEAHIRSSVLEMRRAAAERNQAPETTTQKSTTQSTQHGDSASVKSQSRGATQSMNPDDEEYERLVKEAVRQSLIAHAAETSQAREVGGIQDHRNTHDDDDDDEEDDEALLCRAIEESNRSVLSAGPSGAHHFGASGDGQQAASSAVANENDDEQIRRAMEESHQAHQDHLDRTKAAQTEEDIIMEYMKKQSMAEADFRAKAGRK